MSSISRLDLTKAVDEQAQVAGWDETIDDGQSWQKSSFRVSIASHAMAHQTLVCGIQPGNNNKNANWISWTTSFAPHHVCRVACNTRGTLVAATMDNGTVSILRGVDGTVLATRRVASEGVRIPAEIFFVSGEEQTYDTLVIEPPEEGASPVLVSNMDGDRLNNSSNQGVVSEAARSMVIHALKFEGCDDIRAMRGCSTNQDTLRFAIVDGDGKLAIYDYNLPKKKSVLIQNNISVGTDRKEWEINFDVGLRIQTVRAEQQYLVFSAYSGVITKICWFDLQELSLSCNYVLSNTKPKRSRLLALEPVASCAADSLAVVVAVKSGGENPSIQTRIIQAAVGDSLDSRAVAQPHEVYTIPVPASVQSIGIALVASKKSGPYSFVCKTWMGDEKYDCRLFSTANKYHDGAAIGSARLLMMRGRFNEAQSLVQSIGMEPMTKDAFARFHPSEIALRRLQLILSAGKVSNAESMKNSRDCLRQLAAGALSSGEHGRRALLSAADSILHWPDEKALQNPPTISEVTLALTGFLSVMANVSKAFAESQTSEFDSKKADLEEKLAAMKYLESVLDNDKPVLLNSTFAGIRSPKELFSRFVQENFFLAAEQMWRSELRSKITSDAMVSSVLGVSITENPRKYASLLTEIVFPSLAINHELLPPLLAWSCKTADDFDDETGAESRLNDAIFLLENVERATKDLRIRVHSSFATYAPFVEKSGAKRRKVVSPRNASMMSSALDMSFSSTGSTQSLGKDDGKRETSPESDLERPNPTILELSRMKGGAQKARHGQHASLRVDAIDESEECVESKLSSARCLKHARFLGLDRHIVSLRAFSVCGGAQYIAKELVRLFSSASSTHEERCEKLSKGIRQFCEDAGANFDDALVLYANELCGGKNTSKKAIEESASVARCCLAASTKCQVTLIALRAALFCRFSPSWLSKLSQEAIEWAAGDSSLRSELEEASRLLLIDGIVGRYCGEGAKELYHVDNPRHAIRLLEFVSRHFDHECVLSDTLDLCEAFTHLSREDACSRIIQNAILNGNEATCASLLASLYLRNILLAKSVFSRVMSFCIDLIADGSIGIPFSDNDSGFDSRQVMLTTSCVCVLIPIALSYFQSNGSSHQDGFSSAHFNEARLEGLIQDFQRLNTLQKDHSIFLSIADLHRPKVLVETATKLLGPLVQSYVEGDRKASSTMATQTKRVCSLLADPSKIEEVDLWYAAVGSSACHLAWKTQGPESLEFLSDLGVLEGSNNNLAARSCLAVALSYCMKVSKYSSESAELRIGMKQVLMASSLLQDHANLFCPKDLLGAHLALSDMCDIVSQVLVRTDEGFGEELDDFRKKLHGSAADKRGSFALSEKITRNKLGESLRLRRPILHSTWYVGDGLLLPPSETLVRSVQYCKQSMSSSALDEAIMGLHAFVGGRGAHSLALRLLAHSTVTQMCNPKTFLAFETLADSHRQTVTSLAERYLGGTGNGITSGVIDSQFAVSILLSLPLKLAFKVYRSSLPTAITTRDFDRVVTLASIGKVTGSGELFLTGNSKVLQNWKRQHRFVSQCELLATRANWWSVLQKQHVKFDPHRFEEPKELSSDNPEGGKPQSSSNYAASLVPKLIANFSQKEPDTDLVLQTAMDFAAAFGLSRDLAVQRYVEYLLSPLDSASQSQEISGNSTGKDIRAKLSSLEGVVKTLIRRIDQPVSRVKLLRTCLIRLESSDNGKYYERLSVVLTLYESELSFLLSRKADGPIIDSRLILNDLELVDRRRDALAILSSYFQGDKKQERPSFSSFFVPLPESLDGDRSKLPTRTSRGILGSESQMSADLFDPLDPLEKILRSSCSSAVTSALAPLCLPLGVPRGYIHGRSLIFRFQKSKAEGAALPSFEVDVLPAINRLKSSTDVADLAEWCSSQCDFESEDKLKCLDHSLNFAMQASSTAERHVSQNSSGDLISSQENESKALERVKRITAAKDLLADRLAINIILRSAGITTEKHSSSSKVVDKLMKRLEEEVWSKPEFVPERFVEIFLSESSLLAAEASLCNHEALSVGQFRQLSILIHRACKSVAEKYSHVQVGSLARRLARRWLFHGDQLSTDDDTGAAETPVVEVRNSRGVTSSLLPEIDEDDTVNFVMDLASLQAEDNTWSADIGSGATTNQDTVKLTSGEEPSSLKILGSAREVSEVASRRASLRIAFVMAFADGYHSIGVCDPANDENSRSAANRLLESRGSKLKSKGLLAKIGSLGSKQQHDTVVDHCKELLRIVFAQSGSADWLEKDLNTSIDSRSIGGTSRAASRKTITFAMRHRALRAASILCPQDSLEEVIKEEEFMITNSTCSLKKCSFGAFVAKEIEEMGLPLPHSDLAQLSTMHSPSYARALWRHHRDGTGSKGRLLLLILEMYLKESVSDFGFVLSILSEMQNLNLPRTLLLAFECVSGYMERIGKNGTAPFMEGIGDEIYRAVEGLSRMILADLKKMLSEASISEQEVADGLETSSRLGFVLQTFSQSSTGQQHLERYIEELLKLAQPISKHKEYADKIVSILGQALRRVAHKETGRRLAEKISSFQGEGKHVVQQETQSDSRLVETHGSSNNDELSVSLGRLELSLDNLSSQ